jgi:hypothetical protein
MRSLNDDFNELVERIRHGREFEHASFEPVYYLIFDPKQILDVKRSLVAWQARLRNDNWDVHRLSIADEIADILNHAPMRNIWLVADRKAPQDWKRTNDSLANALTNGALQERLRGRLEALQYTRNALMLVTDLEALHPYLRIGTIEGKLSGSFHVPTVFLYPGKRTGKTRLKFLGFYPEDGNYRSVHVGG